MKFHLENFIQGGAVVTCDGRPLVKRSRGRSEKVAELAVDLPLTGALKLFTEWALDPAKAATLGEFFPKNSAATIAQTGKSVADHKSGSWVGGEATPYHTEYFHSFREDYASSVLAANVDFSEIETAMADITPRRRRAFSEHDGEFIEDRRDEIAPFATTIRAPGATKVITLDVQLCANAGVSASEIQEFGAAVAAIVNLLESNGVLVGLNSLARVRNLDSNGSMNLTLKIGVKKPDEFMAPGQLALASSTAFFRRVQFALFCMATAAVGKDTSEGLGYAPRDSAHAVKGDRLELQIEAFREARRNAGGGAAGYAVAVTELARFILENAKATQSAAA